MIRINILSSTERMNSKYVDANIPIKLKGKSIKSGLGWRFIRDDA